MMAWVFWGAVLLIAYVYVGYPALLHAWASLRPRPIGSDPTAAARTSDLPGISIVIAARNEGARLPARIDNLLALEYPARKRQIIVVSDGSTDDTLERLEHVAPLIDVVSVPAGGKAAALNIGVARARHPIVLFADARQVFAPDALLQLTAPFADPAIGGVTGELLLDAESALFSNRRAASDRRRGHAGQLRAVALERRLRGDRRRPVISTIADGVGMYWRYEKKLRRLESRIGSTLGATGAIYAIRRSLWQPLPRETILDDVLAPMRVVLAGARVVFIEGARAFDRAAPDADAEARRKIRTLAGNYQILWLEPRLLLPWRNPVWLQYVSHKLGRLAIPYALLIVFFANLVLAPQSTFYAVTLGIQVAFYLLAGYGAVLELASRRRPSSARDEVSQCAA